MDRLLSLSSIMGGSLKSKGVRDKEELDYYIESKMWGGDLYMKLLTKKKIFVFNDYGIPIVKYRLTDGRYYYNPTTVCIWGFYNLKRVKQGDYEGLTYIRNCVEWLYDNSEETNYGGSVWRYGMDWQTHGLKVGWISGMTQGLAISLLLRCAKLFGRLEYLGLAEKAFHPMTVPVEEGGAAIVSDDFYWVEEIPSKNPSFVLNGFIFALFGVYDLCRFTGKKMYKEWFDKAILTLVKMLPRFDLGTWSRYDLGLKVVRSKTNLLLEKILSSGEMHNIATPSYNALHVDQLRALYEITGVTQFSYYAKRWSLNPLKYVEFLTYLLST